MSRLNLMMLVDREVNDHFLMQHAFRAAGVSALLLPFLELADAREYLQGRNGWEDRSQHPLPCVIIVDLNFSLERAFGFIAEVRKDEFTKSIPIIALAPAEKSVAAQRAYDAGANAVFVKGVELRPLAETIRDLDFIEELLQRHSNPNSAADAA